MRGAGDAALSTAEAIASAQRGRGERKRPASGASITPAERDVVRLVSEGMIVWMNRILSSTRRRHQFHTTNVEQQDRPTPDPI